MQAPPQTPPQGPRPAPVARPAPPPRPRPPGPRGNGSGGGPRRKPEAPGQERACGGADGRAMAEKFDHLEEHLEKFVENIRQLGIIVSDFQPSSQAGLNQKLNFIVTGLQDIDKCRQQLHDITVPLEVFEYIDQGRNPQLYTKECLERALAKNEQVKGKIDTMKLPTPDRFVPYTLFSTETLLFVFLGFDGIEKTLHLEHGVWSVFLPTCIDSRVAGAWGAQGACSVSAVRGDGHAEGVLARRGAGRELGTGLPRQARLMLPGPPGSVLISGDLAWRCFAKFKSLLIQELSKVFPEDMAKYRSIRGEDHPPS
ncbi:hypothetical protein J1605_022207 [Eschrichtius robustus]|uniref:Mediator of RNA polymerase II transcription subunit 10 n=3 Tax=Laurasiatheria TaxID=314145 RepID=A0AB34HBH3_ESCRO|nr:hypothetical protein J1605_022207 [Eschrichtius robustus]